MEMDVMNLVLILGIAWIVLRVIGDWLLFRKAGKPGWHSIIPILHMIDEYDLCWKGIWGALAALCTFLSGSGASTAEEPTALLSVAGIAGIILLVLEWKESQKLSRAFGKGFLFGLFMFFLGGIGRIILGLGNAQYVGKHW